MTHQARIDQLAEQLVDALARAADHRGEVGLGVGPVEARPRRTPGIGVAREPARRIARRPARSRKWSSSTWPVTRRSSPGRPVSSASRRPGSWSSSSRKHRRGRARVSDALERDRGRRPRRPVQQGELAEEVARAQGGDDRLLALRRWQDDLDRAVADHVQRITRVALVEDHLVASEVPASKPADDVAQRLITHVLEQRAAAE